MRRHVLHVVHMVGYMGSSEIELVLIGADKITSWDYLLCVLICRASSWWRWWYTRGRRGDDPTRGARISCVSPWWTEWQLRLWRSMGRMKNDDTGDHLGGGSADFWLVTTWNRKLLVGSSWWNRPTQWEWRTRQLHVPDQFLRCAHRGRVCVRVFIWMSVHAYLWAFAFVLCLKKNRKLWNAFRQPWYRHTVCNKIV